MIQSYGCRSCDTIHGVQDPDGVVGLPLTGVGHRIYIAGVLRNTPPNIVTALCQIARGLILAGSPSEA